MIHFLHFLDQKLNLQGENCVFINNNKVISLAGVMGGKTSTCCTETTKKLVECAYFNPEAIIGKSVLNIILIQMLHINLREG